MTPSSRKMRRSREATTSNDDAPSGFELYNTQGESAAALAIFQESGSSSFANKYNCALLSGLNSLDPDWKKKLDDVQKLEQDFKARTDDTLSSRKRRRNELIMAFNRALILYSQGQMVQSLKVCLEKLSDAINGKAKPSEELSGVLSKLAFLLLECTLYLTAGRCDDERPLGIEMPSPTVVIDWLDLFDAEKDPRFKFLLNLYKSRCNLASVDKSGKHSDPKIRSARKELKQAMDVFQHKLRPSFGAGETGSVVSSANSEENMSTTASPEQYQQQPVGSVVLQRHNQSALSLKANSEQLKGNTKKSLILCSEALGATEIDAAYEVIHANNLAVVYETIGKRHLALHTLAKALRAKSDDTIFYPDGTARPDQGLLVVYNATICALEARNFVSAYECMAACLVRSDVFRQRPLCWLRLAEACIGVFSDLKKQDTGAKFSAIQVDGETKGIVIDNTLFMNQPDVNDEELVSVLASREDLDQVKRNPLLRARATLRHVLDSSADSLGHEVLTTSRLALAYVHLAFKDYREALNLCKVVLASPVSSVDMDEVSLRSHTRRLATARMYAAEASCALGETVEAMKFLVGDGQDDAFDRLASDIGGVTIETAAANGQGKRRLARAQTIVRSSASAITAAMGNLTAAKQLAMSAQAMEDAIDSNRGSSCARRAQIYTLLRGGHHGTALSLLRSLR